MDQDKDAPKGSPEGDDELENLSSDEKAAFEKIMAEIAAATGGTSKGKGDDPPKKVKSDSPAKASTPASTPVSEEPLPVDNAQADLDKIMAEISSKKGVQKLSSGGPDDSVSNDTSSEDLSSDQQAALDQIMAEIGSKRKADPLPGSQIEPSGNTDEELSQDQQAALDSIMAEIGAKRKADKSPEPAKDASGQDDESLSADQQAALDSIMAEIGSKRKADPAPSVNESPAKPADESAQEDQQADIEKIMAEIEAKKGRAEEEPEPGAETSAEPISTPQKKSGGENLTMEEFDDELSNLLSAAQTAAAPKPAIKAKPADTQKPKPAESTMAEEGGKPAAPIQATISDKEVPKSPDEYPILKEVSVEIQTKSKKSQPARPNLKPTMRARSRMTVIAAASLLVVGIGVYWGYQQTQPKRRMPAATAPETVGQGGQTVPGVVHPSQSETAAGPQTVAVAPTATPVALPVQTPANPAPVARIETPVVMLSAAQSDLSSARQQIQNKINEIEQLKSYYMRGVEEEARMIEDALQSGQVPSFDAALADKKIELSLRSIQRRQTYIAKLDTPLAKLSAMSEQLLYLERKARIYEALQLGITGLPIEAFKNEVTDTVNRYVSFNAQLSIDQVELQPPSLETIWTQIEAELKQKANLLAQRAPLNRTISAEICKGNFERKSLLSALSAETAQCLIKWDGKDLYLNNLSELTPEVAETLARWQGEWISLNGLRQLPAASAKYLSQWPGKRISLNGLSELSPEATAYMSKWKGSQLEMVGLQSIGSWENYGTRLYLSEKLRKQLEAQ